MPVKFPSVPISTPVLFYEQGDENQLPQSARVLLDCNGGILGLSVDSSTGGTPVYKRNVRHVSDHDLLINPDHKRKFGTWDWNPLIKPEVCTFYEVPDAKVTPPVPQPNDKDVEARVRALHDEGKTPAEIAKELRTKGWGKDRVEDYIEDITKAV